MEIEVTRQNRENYAFRTTLFENNAFSTFEQVYQRNMDDDEETFLSRVVPQFAEAATREKLIQERMVNEIGPAGATLNYDPETGTINGI